MSKKVVFEKNMDTYMNYSLKPDFRKAGPVLGGKVKEFGKALAAADAKEHSLQNWARRTELR